MRRVDTEAEAIACTFDYLDDQPTIELWRDAQRAFDWIRQCFARRLIGKCCVFIPAEYATTSASR